MKSRVRPLGAAVIVALLVTLFAPAGAQASESVRGKAQRVLVSQGMPADLAGKIANDKSAKITVKANEVYVDDTSMREIQATAASFTNIVPGAKGSDWWYAAAVNSLGQVKTVVRIRYSWSWMWVLKNSVAVDTAGAFAALACGLLPTKVLQTACGSVVISYLAYVKTRLNQGIDQKKCLQIQMPAPPLVDYSLIRFSLVTCRV